MKELQNKKMTTEDREQDDFYTTDPVSLEKLLMHLSNCGTDDPDFTLRWAFDGCKSEDRAVWECAAGNGNLSNYLRENGYRVIASDLKNRGGYSVTSDIDFLKTGDCFWSHYGAMIECNIILTNPPYSLANEFILHALDILPEGGFYIALMNITYLHGIARYEQIYSKGCLRYVYVFSKKISCWKNGVRDDKGGRMIVYAWYVFQKGYDGVCSLFWL